LGTPDYVLAGMDSRKQISRSIVVNTGEICSQLRRMVYSVSVYIYTYTCTLWLQKSLTPGILSCLHVPA